MPAGRAPDDQGAADSTPPAVGIERRRRLDRIAQLGAIGRGATPPSPRTGAGGRSRTGCPAAGSRRRAGARPARPGRPCWHRAGARTCSRRRTPRRARRRTGRRRGGRPPRPRRCGRSRARAARRYSSISSSFSQVRGRSGRLAAQASMTCAKALSTRISNRAWRITLRRLFGSWKRLERQDAAAPGLDPVDGRIEAVVRHREHPAGIGA